MMALRKRFFARSLALGDRSQDQIYGDLKAELFRDVQGTVLEIGAGSGINLPFFPEAERWIGIEPNPFSHKFIHEKAVQLEMDIELLATRAESIDLPDESVDVVVSTLVLCSLEDPSKGLREIHRLLKPGGRFLFIEHVAAPPGTRLRRAQHLIRPMWHVLADGCFPDRETAKAIEKTGFSDIDISSFDAQLPFTIRLIKPHIMGEAVK